MGLVNVHVVGHFHVGITSVQPHVTLVSTVNIIVCVECKCAEYKCAVERTSA